MSTTDQTTTDQPTTENARPTVWRRAVTGFLALSIAIVALLLPAGAASATQRLPNGAYGSYGLDCSNRSARLTVQGGANGIPVNGYKYWLYSVDYGVYVVSGQWVPMGTGWRTVTNTLVYQPGRYQVYVEYYSYTGGIWYAKGEWTWAKNLVQPTSSQTCIVN
jgi:hypothetical protein